MTGEEQKEKEREFKQLAVGLLGHCLKVFECKWYGGHPVAHVVYWDYKVSIITRAELQQLMPGVEFATIKREFSTAAMMEQLWDVLVNNDPTVIIKGQQEPLQELCERLLYNRDLSLENLRYSEDEKKTEICLMCQWDF